MSPLQRRLLGGLVLYVMLLTGALAWLADEVRLVQQAPPPAQVVRWRVGPECYVPIVLERAEPTEIDIPIGDDNHVLVNGLQLHRLGIQQVDCAAGEPAAGVGGIVLGDDDQVLYLDGPILFDGAHCPGGMCMQWQKPGAQVIYGWEKEQARPPRGSKP